MQPDFHCGMLPRHSGRPPVTSGNIRSPSVRVHALDSLITALLIGLFSTVHCLGMCGGIVGALTFSLPTEVRGQPARLGTFLLAYNGGRLASYALAGAAIGLLGGGLYGALPAGGHLFLQALAATLMVGIGLYLAGWFPRFAAIERLGIPLWRRLEPLGRRLLPVRHPGLALLYGAVWGWLPCGLVYSALLLTVTAGGPAEGALFMAAFGIGTLPATLGAGILTRQIHGLTRDRRVRQVAGLLLVLLALAGFLFAGPLHQSLPFSSEEETLQCRD